MKIFLLFIIVLSSLLHATIDERKSDVYFANGIDTDELTAKDSIDEIEREFKSAYPTAYTSVANWDTVYNHTHGIGSKPRRWQKNDQAHVQDRACRACASK